MSSHSITNATFDVSPCKNANLQRGAYLSTRLHADVILLIRPVMGQKRPYHARHLVGQRNDYDIQRPPLCHLLNPGTGILSTRHDAARTVDQEGTQIRITSFADPVQIHLSARSSLLWHKACPRGKLPP
ncbi:protein of unknown function (plasmid) [Cupriavidus taiwanensis]|uniref:Uncharacterized protein n=1 Tax=Cupriavidus taiwanensis TaxID=164546 RepID=A0A9Q7UZ13_9BURK|nr:protein of unknown function [Cupriavidus taiwanensis]